MQDPCDMSGGGHCPRLGGKQSHITVEEGANKVLLKDEEFIPSLQGFKERNAVGCP